MVRSLAAQPVYLRIGCFALYGGIEGERGERNGIIVIQERERERETTLFTLLDLNPFARQAFKRRMGTLQSPSLKVMACTPGIDYSRLPRSDSAAFALLCQNGWHDSDPEPAAALPPQVDSAYTMLRTGKTEIEIRLAIQEIYGKSARPNLAFKNALELVIQEQRAQREHMPELIMSIRWKAIQLAIQAGQLGAAAGMLRDAGAACGEAGLDAAAATLTVQVLPPRPDGPDGPPAMPSAACDTAEGEA